MEFAVSRLLLDFADVSHDIPFRLPLKKRNKIESKRTASSSFLGIKNVSFKMSLPDFFLTSHW